nr:60S ribosomal protein L7a-2-like [Ipomoea batatas]
MKRAQAESEGKTPELKKPIVVKYGLKHVTYLIEQNKAQLVVIAHDVDPTRTKAKERVLQKEAAQRMS